MATLRELFISIGLDADTEGFNQLERGLGTIKKFAFAAAAAVGGLSAAVFAVAKTTADYADTIQDTAWAIGVSNKELQTLGFAAKLSGSSLQEAGDAFRYLARNANEAATSGTGPAAEAFQALGVRVTGANGKIKDSNQLMLEIADRFKSLPNGAQKTALAMDIFGRSGAKLIPLLNSGSDGIASMRGEAERLGLVLSDEAIQAGSDFNDALDRLMAVFIGLRNSIGAAVMPALQTLIDGMREALEANIDWIRSGIARAMNGVILVVRNLGQAVQVLASGFGWLTDRVGGLVPILKVAGALMLAWTAGRLVQSLVQVGQGFAIIAKSIRLVNLQAFLIPALIGAAVLAIVAIIDDVIAYFQGRPSVLGFLIENKDAILQTISESFDQVIAWANAMLESWFGIMEDMIAAVFEWAGVAPAEAEETAGKIVGVFRFLKDVVADTLQAMMDGFGILWPWVLEGAKTMVVGFKAIFEGIEVVVDTFLDGVKAALAGISSLITSPLEALREVGDIAARLLGFGPEVTIDRGAVVSPQGIIGAPSVDRMAQGISSQVDNRSSRTSTNMSPTINVSVQGGGADTGNQVAAAIEEAMGDIFRSVERSNKPAFAQ